MTSDSCELRVRIALLERQQQRSRRRLSFGALGVVSLGLVAFSRGVPDPVVRAEQVEIISASGTRQAALTADSAGVILTLFTAKGRPASAIHLSDSTLTLLNASGDVVATLGGPKVRHLE